jgi:hypothetical protein
MPSRRRIDDSSFALEYERLSDAELAAESARVEAQFNASRAAAFAAEYSAGRGELLPQDDDGKPVFAGVHNEEIYSTRTTVDRPGEVELVVLDFGRHSAVYDEGNRFFWLMKESNRRKKR